MTLTKEQECLYQELMNTETELFYLTPRDCKQLVKGLTRMGVKTPKQLKLWFESLHEAEDWDLSYGNAVCCRALALSRCLLMMCLLISMEKGLWFRMLYKAWSLFFVQYDFLVGKTRSRLVDRKRHSVRRDCELVEHSYSLWYCRYWFGHHLFIECWSGESHASRDSRWTIKDCVNIAYTLCN